MVPEEGHFLIMSASLKAKYQSEGRMLNVSFNTLIHLLLIYPLTKPASREKGRWTDRGEMEVFLQG